MHLFHFVYEVDTLPAEVVGTKIICLALWGIRVRSSAGSIPDSYDIYRYLNLVRYSIHDTFVVNLPKTYA